MTTKFVIVGAPRTGSTLLVRTLNQLDGVCCHGELLGEDHVRGFEDGIDLVSMSHEQRTARLERLLLERNANPVAFIDRALDFGGAATGFKALYSALLNPRWRNIATRLQYTENIHFVHLTRANGLRRFVSEQILLQGGPNHSGAGGKSEVPIQVHIDIDLFGRRSAELETQASQIDALLSGQTVLPITYEALSADTAATVAHVCRFLGLDIAAPAITPALQKVGATDLRDSVSNYQELLDHPATRALALAD
jgi:LPS sulfotransferase NodH